MAPDLAAAEAAMMLITAFIALVFINAVVICVPVTQDGPVDPIDPPADMPLWPGSEWTYSAPTYRGPVAKASAEAERIWTEIADWARADEARRVRR